MTYQDNDGEEDFLPEEAARVRFLQNSLEAERLLKRGGAFELIVDHALEDAHAALSRLVDTRFTSLDEVKEAQWQVQRFEALCRYINGILSAGKEVMLDATNDQREALEKMIRGEEEIDHD